MYKVLVEEKGTGRLLSKFWRTSVWRHGETTFRPEYWDSASLDDTYFNAHPYSTDIFRAYHYDMPVEPAFIGRNDDKGALVLYEVALPSGGRVSHSDIKIFEHSADALTLVKPVSGCFYRAPSSDTGSDLTGLCLNRSGKLHTISLIDVPSDVQVTGFLSDTDIGPNEWMLPSVVMADPSFRLAQDPTSLNNSPVASSAWFHEGRLLLVGCHDDLLSLEHFVRPIVLNGVRTFVLLREMYQFLVDSLFRSVTPKTLRLRARFARLSNQLHWSQRRHRHFEPYSRPVVFLPSLLREFMAFAARELDGKSQHLTKLSQWEQRLAGIFRSMTINPHLNLSVLDAFWVMENYVHHRFGTAPIDLLVALRANEGIVSTEEFAQVLDVLLGRKNGSPAKRTIRPISNGAKTETDRRVARTLKLAIGHRPTTKKHIRISLGARMMQLPQADHQLILTKKMK